MSVFRTSLAMLCATSALLSAVPASAAYLISLDFPQRTGTVASNALIPVNVRATLSADSDALTTDAGGNVTSPYGSYLADLGLTPDDVTSSYINIYFLCNSSFIAGCGDGAYHFDFNFSMVAPTNLDFQPGNAYSYAFGSFTPVGGNAPSGTYDFFGAGLTLNFNTNAGTKSVTLAQTCAPQVADCQFTRTIYAANGAVPEPASWALMMIGFGAIGGALRKSRRTTTVSYC
jgi:PEP-CTERM motif